MLVSQYQGSQDETLCYYVLVGERSRVFLRNERVPHAANNKVVDIYPNFMTTYGDQYAVVLEARRICFASLSLFRMCLIDNFHAVAISISMSRGVSSHMWGFPSVLA